MQSFVRCPLYVCAIYWRDDFENAHIYVMCLQQLLHRTLLNVSSAVTQVNQFFTRKFLSIHLSMHGTLLNVSGGERISITSFIWC